ncbi:nascent polypeptide-associated complex subunit alpha, muscle-specific form-like [Perognathus longimembris pacificus]|uniref:nascent polypeptide-associated complex subunit alpha, muscle-specific form-like n=1 Tax=Perognathus longimembris pacificus TaxID=214514 RepID=UPI002019B28A|nr:nascent polypeptide-associated complex subunit alpha, muscle-specific form-like [Perognathus longimembris pacificus]
MRARAAVTRPQGRCRDSRRPSHRTRGAPHSPDGFRAPAPGAHGGNAAEGRGRGRDRTGSLKIGPERSPRRGLGLSSREPPPPARPAAPSAGAASPLLLPPSLAWATGQRTMQICRFALSPPPCMERARGRSPGRGCALSLQRQVVWGGGSLPVPALCATPALLLGHGPATVPPTTDPPRCPPPRTCHGAPHHGPTTVPPNHRPTTDPPRTRHGAPTTDPCHGPATVPPTTDPPRTRHGAPQPQTRHGPATVPPTTDPPRTRHGAPQPQTHHGPAMVPPPQTRHGPATVPPTTDPPRCPPPRTHHGTPSPSRAPLGRGTSRHRPVLGHSAAGVARTAGRGLCPGLRPEPPGEAQAQACRRPVWGTALREPLYFWGSRARRPGDVQPAPQGPACSSRTQSCPGEPGGAPRSSRAIASTSSTPDGLHPLDAGACPTLCPQNRPDCQPLTHIEEDLV